MPVSSVCTADSPISWIVWLAVMFAVVFGLLLLKNLFRDPECCTYWRTKKDVKQHTENPKFNGNQWWNITKYISSSPVHKCSFDVLVQLATYISTSL